MKKESKGEGTRRHVLERATELFNKSGTHAINTHHIAQAADMSPGNLYYHFKDKAEIIRGIFSEMELFSSATWEKASASADSQGFYQFVKIFFSQIGKYQFFFREQVELFREDPALARQWKGSMKKLSEAMRATAQHWVKLDILKKFDSLEEVDRFIDNCWIILTYAYSFFQSQGETGKAALEQHTTEQFMAFLRPYHTAKGQKILERYLAENCE